MYPSNKISYKENEQVGNCFFIQEIYPFEQRRAIFKCYCGREFEARIQHVKSKQTQSCGCLNSKLAADRLLKHGQARIGKYSVEYTTWASMKQRCYDSNTKSYSTYGGRGIKMCDRWFENFENFFRDMGERPSPKHSIDRIDNNGNYCPENCRWTTKEVQSRNTSFNRFLTLDNRTQCITDWAREYNMSCSKLSRRLKKGKTLEEAISY